jgi:hypothetical protein
MSRCNFIRRLRLFHFLPLLLCAFFFILTQVYPTHLSHLVSTFSSFLAASPIQEDDVLASPTNSKSSSIQGNTRDKSEYGIHVIGERHTGTSWLYRHLDQCFGDQVKVYDRLSRHKYWFQLDDGTKDYGLVVATSRNVYDWLSAMMEKPLHAPIHYDSAYNRSMSLLEFIRTEWAPDFERWAQLNLIKHNQQLLYAYEPAGLSQGKPVPTKQCYDGFAIFDVIPCSFEDRMRTSGLVTVRGDPDNNVDDDSSAVYEIITVRGNSDFEDDIDFSAVYEMKKDHPIGEMKPYKSILELRRDKMIHFHSEVPKFSSVQHYIPFKFEDMVELGTASLLQDIEKQMGVQSRCQPDKLHTPENGSKRQFLSPPDVSRINENVDWEAEAIVGYEKIPVVQQVLSQFEPVAFDDDTSYVPGAALATNLFYNGSHFVLFQDASTNLNIVVEELIQEDEQFPFVILSPSETPQQYATFQNFTWILIWPEPTLSRHNFPFIEYIRSMWALFDVQMHRLYPNHRDLNEWVEHIVLGPKGHENEWLKENYTITEYITNKVAPKATVYMNNLPFESLQTEWIKFDKALIVEKRGLDMFIS